MCKPESQNILNIIRRIRESFSSSVEVYTRGSCVKFSMILQEIFPQGEIYYNEDHSIFELNGSFYDITGEVLKTNHTPLKERKLVKAYDLMNLKYEDKV